MFKKHAGNCVEVGSFILTIVDKNTHIFKQIDLQLE